MLRTALLIVLALSPSLLAGDSVAVVSNVKVLSDKVEDVSSFEAWRNAVIKDGMSDQEKAVAIFNTIVKFRHFEPPPQEFTGYDDARVQDAFKLFNVYGYGGAQTALVQLARSLKFEARSWTANRWGQVAEIFYDGGWHYFDPVLISYYLKPDGKVAGVEEIVASAKAWYDKNPGYLGDVPKIKAFMKEQGIANGPELLRNCPTLEKNGSFIFNYFGWYTSMLIFDGSNKTPFPFEEAHTQGYRVNIQLRKGERMTRNWGHTGLHVNMDGGKAPELLNAKTGSGVLYYTPKLGDLANGRVGNGTVEYSVPLADPLLRSASLAMENLEQAGGALSVKDAAQPGVFVLRRPCSYVYLSGTLNLDARIGDGGEVAVHLSDNHGLDWKEIAKLPASGKQSVVLKPHVFGHYDYRVKFVLKGAGTALAALQFVHDIQHSQRPLPALGKGDNTISFSAGAPEGTITIESTGTKFKGKQPTVEDFKVQVTDGSGAVLPQTGLPSGSCNVTIPIETPGEITRLRFGCNYRARAAGDVWELQVSFDDGKTFKTVERAAGVYNMNGKYAATTDIPAGTRKAKVRFAGTQAGTLLLFGWRVDADYKEPAGGFAPVKITYQWEENGAAKQHVHIAKAADEKYTIKCDAQPVMKSIVLELAE